MPLLLVANRVYKYYKNLSIIENVSVKTEWYFYNLILKYFNNLETLDRCQNSTAIF